MVLQEFVTALQQEIESEDASGSESNTVLEPFPYDIFLMDAVTSRQPHPCYLAVFMPRRKGNQFVWYNGATFFWPLDVAPRPRRRVASLCGPARILEALTADLKQQQLMVWAMQREMIRPAVENVRPHLVTVDSNLLDGLNHSQQRAVATVLDKGFTQGFFPIQGPPGCGKTTTLVTMIQSLSQQVIVAAPSNAAVANVALKLFETNQYDLNQLVIFGARCDESVNFLNPRVRGEKFAQLRRRIGDIDGRPKTTDEAKTKEKERLRLEFQKWLHVKDDSVTLAQMGELCPLIDMNKKHCRHKYGKILSHAQVVLSTLNKTGSTSLRANARADIIFLDEAGQCTEAEFYIAASFPGVKRMVVVGDPKQLPSTVVDRFCQRVGYGESWLGRILQLCGDVVHLLDTQYRMDPRILEFSNRYFYSNRIISGANVKSRCPVVEKPFLFIDMQGRGKEEQISRSWRNVHEPTSIHALLTSGRDKDVISIMQQGSGCRIIVITPYTAQMKLLKRMILQSWTKSQDQPRLEIATVDSFQGQEGDLVIISTVKTNRVGFVDDAQRINVALTRAKRVLRVFGEAAFFDSLAPSSTLRSLSEFARTKRLAEEGSRSESRTDPRAIADEP